MNTIPSLDTRRQYGKPAGTLLGAEPLVVKGAIEQVAPKAATFRIPGGDKQVLMVFTRPDVCRRYEEYAVPVGYRQGGDYTFYTDEIFSTTIRMSSTNIGDRRSGRPWMATRSSLG